MKVITVASRKGGGGKSTVARHLAVEANSQNCGPVCIIDADPMLGLAQWWSRRDGDEPRLLHALPENEAVTAGNIRKLVGDGNLPLPISKLGTALKAAEKAGYALCVIDTAPATDPDVRRCIAAADLGPHASARHAGRPRCSGRDSQNGQSRGEGRGLRPQRRPKRRLVHPRRRKRSGSSRRTRRTDHSSRRSYPGHPWHWPDHRRNRTVVGLGRRI